MLKMTKSKNGHDYEAFEIETNEGKFNISFEGNLDLYWWYVPNKNILEAPQTKEFIITKEDYFIYNTFDELYNSIKNDKPYFNLSYDNGNKDKKIKVYDKNNPERLFKNEGIEWHSDDFEYECSSYVRIEKCKEGYKVIFSKSKGNIYDCTYDTMYMTYSVRFRNRGSRYIPFNTTFMSMYNKLSKYNFNYHQIHMEEYMQYKKTLK